MSFRISKTGVCAAAFAVAFINVSTAAVKWPMELLKTAPQTYDASKYATNTGVQVTFFDGLPFKGKPTRVFAYYGIPKHKPGEKVPAMVLVHGGGGSAFHRWVKFWNSKGYAAISMDTCGSVSGNVVGSEQRKHFRHAWAGPAGWGSFWSMGDADEDQWVYHAVAAVVRANSFLRSLPDVDPERIGVTGVSWGGFLTCIAASIDDRFRFAAPVYGCGANFVKSPAWKKNVKILGEANVPKWKERWDPINYLPQSKVPTHWLDGSNDPWFSLPSVEECRRAVPAGGYATYRVRMVHTHGPISEEAKELVALADHYLKGGAPMPKFGEVQISGNAAHAAFIEAKGRKAVKATIDYTLDRADECELWFDRYWHSKDARIVDGRVEVELPPATSAFYLNLETADGVRTSSRVVELEKPMPMTGCVEVRVRQTKGGPMIHINGKPVPPRFFFGCRAYDVPDSKNPFFHTLAHCRDAGVRLISFPMTLCWEDPARGPRWDQVDSLFDRILAVHPDALLIPRVYINAPKWLLDKHPDWQMKFDDGKEYGRIASVSAHDYREQVAKHLERLVRHLYRAYPRNYGGIHPAGPSYGEFFYMESLGPVLHGLETPVRDAWRKWLKSRGEKGADTAEIPTPEERRSHKGGMLRDPVIDRKMVLFSQFEQDEMADFVAAMAAAARRGSEGRKLVMVFHGYGFEHTTVPNGAAVTGDYGSEQLFRKAAGNIDLLCSPFSYVNRRYLAPTMTQVAAESAILRGIMPLDEDDTRTYLVTHTNALELAGGWIRPKKAQTMRQLRNNLASCIMRGRASWWMDLTGRGWYNDRDLWSVMETMRPLDEKMFARRSCFSPEIALLLDEHSMLYAAAGSRVAFEPLIKRAREGLERCGVPYGQYFVTDALAGRLKSAKLQIFTSSFYAGTAEKVAIARHRKMHPDVTRVWCWAPGWLAERGRDDENIFRTTGFKARRIAAAHPKVKSTAAGKALGFPDSWQGLWVVDPLFAVEAAEEDILAKWPDGSAAVAVRRNGKGTDVFCGIPALPTHVLAGFAKLAGCKFYADPDTAYVHAAEGFVHVEPLERLEDPK